jgi:hypothetical protein
VTAGAKLGWAARYSDGGSDCDGMTGLFELMDQSPGALPWNLDRSPVVVLADVPHGFGPRNAVEDGQAGKRRACPTPTAAAGHIHPLDLHPLDLRPSPQLE